MHGCAGSRWRGLSGLNYMEHHGQGRPPVMGAHRLIFFFFFGGGGEEAISTQLAWLTPPGCRRYSLPCTDRHEALRYNVSIFGWEEINSEIEHLTSEGKELLCSLVFKVERDYSV